MTDQQDQEKVTFRKVYTADLKYLARLEAESGLWHDPDFDRVCLNPWVWDFNDVRNVLVEPQTAGWLVTDGMGNLAGYFVYEPDGKDALLIRRLVVHPKFRLQDYGRTILHHLYQRIVRSEKRKTLRVLVRENDTDTCRWFAHMGFKSRLVRRGWSDDLDAVEFSFTTAKHAEDESPDRAGWPYDKP